ncbi:MAG: TlpA family protein disulfide reductase [Clostridiales bacterium]|nr:TlpA family protein disulfide reductase [Clostridiales bacterium]
MKKAYLKTALLALAACFALSAVSCRRAEPLPEPTEIPIVTPDPDDVFGLTKDVFGEHVAFADYSEKDVVMINFWETWCGPCMGEMADLEALYEEHESEGFAIIGVYSSSKTADVKAVAENFGITYRLVPTTRQLRRFATRYVPTTVFVNGKGELLSEEPIVGAKSRSEWEEIISSLLQNTGRG